MIFLGGDPYYDQDAMIPQWLEDRLADDHAKIWVMNPAIFWAEDLCHVLDLGDDPRHGLGGDPNNDPSGDPPTIRVDDDFPGLVDGLGHDLGGGINHNTGGDPQHALGRILR